MNKRAIGEENRVAFHAAVDWSPFIGVSSSFDHVMRVWGVFGETKIAERRAS